MVALCVALWVPGGSGVCLGRSEYGMRGLHGGRSAVISAMRGWWLKGCYVSSAVPDCNHTLAEARLAPLSSSRSALNENVMLAVCMRKRIGL